MSRVTYTQDVDASGEAARGRAEWPGQQHEFTASSAAVMLCFELRNLRDRTDAGRSQLGKAGSRNVFSSLGSVRSRRNRPLQRTATGCAAIHTFAGGSASHLQGVGPASPTHAWSGSWYSCAVERDDCLICDGDVAMVR